MLFLTLACCVCCCLFGFFGHDQNFPICRYIRSMPWYKPFKFGLFHLYVLLGHGLVTVPYLPNFNIPAFNGPVILCWVLKSPYIAIMAAQG